VEPREPGSGRARVSPGQRRSGGYPRTARPPPWRPHEVGEARLPSVLTMDSSRAGLCPERPANRPGPRDAAGCPRQRLKTGRRVCEWGTMRTRLGATGRSSGAVSHSRGRCLELPGLGRGEGAGFSRGSPGLNGDIQASGPWRRRKEAVRLGF
jgi:hypothetical protein